MRHGFFQNMQYRQCRIMCPVMYIAYFTSTLYFQSLHGCLQSPCSVLFLAPAVTVGERRELWILPPFFFWPLLLPITL